jgi:hypothetical protein
MSLVPETGLEPALPEGNQPLKLARLPIPPLRLGCNPQSSITLIFNPRSYVD